MMQMGREQAGLCMRAAVAITGSRAAASSIQEDPLPVVVAGQHMGDVVLPWPQHDHCIVRSICRPGAIARPIRQARAVPTK